MASRLALGAVAVFFAIVFWSKARDAVWMLVIIGVIAGYAETVYSVLESFGITGQAGPAIGSVPLLSILLANLPAASFLAAFATAAARRYRKRL
ncbi:MAG: hypothetical protein LBI91_08175 [Spirochaetaceae bacterium]|jgi:hypothetical protein|nr:hypothetical protein [Spirochaetaceae bacterium]